MTCLRFAIALAAFAVGWIIAHGAHSEPSLIRTFAIVGCMTIAALAILWDDFPGKEQDR